MTDVLYFTTHIALYEPAALHIIDVEYILSIYSVNYALQLLGVQESLTQMWTGTYLAEFGGYRILELLTVLQGVCCATAW